MLLDLKMCKENYTIFPKILGVSEPCVALCPEEETGVWRGKVKRMDNRPYCIVAWGEVAPSLGWTGLVRVTCMTFQETVK